MNVSRLIDQHLTVIHQSVEPEKKDGDKSCSNGYKNVRDDDNKGLIIPDKNAQLVKLAFEVLSKGIYTGEEVRMKIWKMD